MQACDPILVASPPRSGSSLTAGLIAHAGAWAGWTKVGDVHNRKGYYENVELDRTLARYLSSCDEFRLGKRFQPKNLSEPLPDFRDVVFANIEIEGYQGGPWVFKSTKTAICRNLFLGDFPDSRWVLVKRDRKATIRSLMRTPFMDGYETEADWDRFLETYDSYMSDIQDRAKHSHVFRADLASQGDLHEVTMLLDFLELEADPARLSQVWIAKELMNA